MVNIIDIPYIETNNANSVSIKSFLRPKDGSVYIDEVEEHIGFNRIQLCRLAKGTIMILFGFFMDVISMRS
jgi:hypothetical protein